MPLNYKHKQHRRSNFIQPFKHTFSFSRNYSFYTNNRHLEDCVSPNNCDCSRIREFFTRTTEEGHISQLPEDIVDIRHGDAGLHYNNDGQLVDVSTSVYYNNIDSLSTSRTYPCLD